MTLLLAAAGGGAIGAAARYLVGVGAIRLFGMGFPWGTLIVNVTGCLIMGMVIEAKISALTKNSDSDNEKRIITVLNSFNLPTKIDKEMKIENNRVYYEASLAAKDIEKFYYLSNNKVMSILEFLDTNSNGHTKSEISNNLDMHYNTVKKYLNKLVELERIKIKKVSNKILYFIRNSQISE